MLYSLFLFGMAIGLLSSATLAVALRRETEEERDQRVAARAILVIGWLPFGGILLYLPSIQESIGSDVSIFRSYLAGYAVTFILFGGYFLLDWWRGGRH